MAVTIKAEFNARRWRFMRCVPLSALPLATPMRTEVVTGGVGWMSEPGHFWGIPVTGGVCPGRTARSLEIAAKSRREQRVHTGIIEHPVPAVCTMRHTTFAEADARCDGAAEPIVDSALKPAWS